MQTRPVMVMSNVTSVSCGDGFTTAIKDDGTLWIWGNNHDGQLGNGGTGNSTVWDTSSRFYFHNIDNTIGTFDDSGPVPVITDVSFVAFFMRGIVLKTDGSLWMRDNNSTMQRVEKKNMFNGVFVKWMDNVAAVSVGNHVAVIKMDGSVWCWGSNDDGEIGNGMNSPDNRSTGLTQSTPYMVEGILAKLP